MDLDNGEDEEEAYGGKISMSKRLVLNCSSSSIERLLHLRSLAVPLVTRIYRTTVALISIVDVDYLPAAEFSDKVEVRHFEVSRQPEFPANGDTSTSAMAPVICRLEEMGVVDTCFHAHNKDSSEGEVKVMWLTANWNDKSKLESLCNKILPFIS